MSVDVLDSEVVWWRQNFLACDREQELLLPPSLREWLPEDHLAWFVLDAVEEIDLSAFYGAYRAGRLGSGGDRAGDDGGAVAVRYAVGERSSRRIERRCREDVAFRVICGQPGPRSRDDRALSRPS